MQVLVHIPGIPCTNPECRHVWKKQGWIVAVDETIQSAFGKWLKVCPECATEQPHPAVFDKIGPAAAEAASKTNGKAASISEFPIHRFVPPVSDDFVPSK